MGKIFDALEKASRQSSQNGSATADKEKRDHDRIDKRIVVPFGEPNHSIPARNRDVHHGPQSDDTKLLKVLKTHSFSRSEILEILGIDEKQLHRFAHKGMINPILSNDSSTPLTPLDCVRLKIINRADEHGYGAESLTDLIGSYDAVLNEKDPVATCESFALEKYKKVQDDLNDCEPLEQINKQCDLSLLTNYITLLKALQDKSIHNPRPPNAQA